jgi:hypothetical protein
MLEHHDLLHEFPEHRDRIHNLKLSDHHFARLFKDYHDLTKDVERIEAGAEAASDERLTDLRKQRLHVKDELYAMLIKHG